MLIFGLFLAPDFTPEMESGTAPPPYINHDEINWGQFCEELSDYFEIPQQGVTLRLADDTVDQVTLQMREYGVSKAPMDCSDFGEVLLKEAHKMKSGTVLVQGAWENLHHLKDRPIAPPPAMIPLIFSGDTADIMSLVFNIMLHMNVPAAKHPERRSSGGAVSDDFYQGQLPDPIMQLLQKHFGVAFKKVATLIPLAR